MRPQLDLRPGRVMLAVGAAGLGSTWFTGGVAHGAGGPASPTTPVAALALGGIPALSEQVGNALGGVLAPALALTAIPRAPVGPSPQRTLSAAISRRDLLAGRPMSVRGELRPDTPGRVVVLQERRGRAWVQIARGSTGRTGRYTLGFKPPAPGSLALRVRFAGDEIGGEAISVLGVINVYRVAAASWYAAGGPLACGGMLTDGRLGVAHRTLPCGTLVALRLGSRTVTVPVIDRGPYVPGRDYDLTPATRRALGFGDVGEVWATR